MTLREKPWCCTWAKAEGRQKHASPHDVQEGMRSDKTELPLVIATHGCHLGGYHGTNTV